MVTEPTDEDPVRPDPERPDPERPDPERPDPERPDPERPDPAWERPIDRFRRTTTGTIVAAGLLGIRDVMEGRPEKEEVTIVSEAPAQPVRDLDIVIDPEHPERTIAIVRRPAPHPAEDAEQP